MDKPKHSGLHHSSHVPMLVYYFYRQPRGRARARGDRTRGRRGAGDDRGDRRGRVRRARCGAGSRGSLEDGARIAKAGATDLAVHLARRRHGRATVSAHLTRFAARAGISRVRDRRDRRRASRRWREGRAALLLGELGQEPERRARCLAADSGLGYFRSVPPGRFHRRPAVARGRR